MKKNTRSADFCADRIDVITNFAVITNVVIKRVHCKSITGSKMVSYNNGHIALQKDKSANRQESNSEGPAEL